MDDLIAFAWSAPMRELAVSVGVSDVGLKKLLTGLGVVCPPQGHWNRVLAGRPVEKPPKAPPRLPGQHPALLLDGRLSKLLPIAPEPSAQGPFASPNVPEDLEGLRQKELAAIGRAVSAAKLADLHSSVKAALERDEYERQRAINKDWHVPKVQFESPFERRRLRILNAIFRTLQKRGHRGTLRSDEYHTDIHVTIGDTYVPIMLFEGRKAKDYSRYSAPKPDPKRSANCVLTLTAGEERWTDDASGTLETKIAAISAGLIVEGERIFRMQMRELAEQRERAFIEAEKKRERERVEAEKRRIAAIEKASADRLDALRESGRLIAEADDLRRLIAAVAVAVQAGSVDLPAEAFGVWRAWAEAEADRIDPVKSGQIWKHLKPPVVD
ncbi:hypothetical protein [Sphingomonas sp. Leaf25]|uniref:hypothetical protein n=1 Tax=Sphingomonas sp. Leaf25 TaxID=1735692 RepID=UPI001F1BF7BF|nr:hypothetical protein [Sphingomonas sp. Leaf25]